MISYVKYLLSAPHLLFSYDGLQVFIKNWLSSQR